MPSPPVSKKAAFKSSVPTPSKSPNSSSGKTTGLNGSAITPAGKTSILKKTVGTPIKTPTTSSSKTTGPNVSFTSPTSKAPISKRSPPVKTPNTSPGKKSGSNVSFVTPYKLATDSPSRQLLWELAQLQIQETRAFNEACDKLEAERQREYRAALAVSKAEHERVRRNAEIERERLELQIANERKRRELEAQRKLDIQREEEHRLKVAEYQAREERDRKIAQEIEEAAEALRKSTEAFEAQQQAAARCKAEELKKHEVIKRREDEAAAIRRELAAKDEKQRKAAEAQKAAEDALNAQRQIQNQALPSYVPAQNVTLLSTISKEKSTTSPPAKAQSNAVDPAIKAEHSRYMYVHGQLKDLRKQLSELGKDHPKLKSLMGDGRRNIQTRLGQLTAEKGSNRQQVQSVLNTMKSAYQLEDSADVNIYEFIFNPPKGEAQGSALLIYFLNILAKKLVAQLARESGVSAKLADAIGILGSTIFAQDDCHIKGHHMGDIVLAKFHRDCPVLFGIYGPEDTDAGKARLGWAKEGQKGQQNWVDFQTHLTNMTGYGVGFAALTLRNYEKSKNQNPLPVYHFWRAVALITNTPDNEITNTHCIVLKAMIENNEERIVQFFGDFGLALMKRALIEFPLRAGQSEKGNVAAKAMLALAEKMEKEKGVYLM